MDDRWFHPSAVRRRRDRLEPLAWVALAMLVACTPFEPGTDELGGDGDDVELGDSVVQQGLEPGGSWACLPATFEPTRYLEGRESAPRLVRSLQLLNLVTETPIAGLSVRACAQRDIECVEPVSIDMPVGADGWVDVPLYEGFQGYLEITGQTVIPTILVFADPVVGPDPNTEPFALVERNLLPALTNAVGTQQSPDLGLVALRALDCDKRDATGVHYAIDKAGVAWYFVGGLPSDSVTETADSSLGGFLNVASGIATVNATLQASMRQLVAPTSVIVRGGWMTQVRFLPLSQ